MVKALATNYNGHRFRSRLEARWAMVFDELGIKWTYEPEGFLLPDNTCYLPDFYLTELDCFIEVKRKQFTETEYNKAAQLPKPCILLDEPKPTLKKFYYVAGYKHLQITEAGDTINLDSYKYYLGGDSYNRILLDWSAAKKRLWFSYGEGLNSYAIDQAPVNKANKYWFDSVKKG